MSQRSTIFLTEMGVGPQWTLRQRPAGADGAESADLAGMADMASPAAVAPPPPAEAAPLVAVATVPEAPASQQPTFARPQAEQAQPLAAEPEPVAAPLAAAVAATATASIAEPLAASVSAAVPESPAAVAAPAAASPMAGPPATEAAAADASTAWFDDAPAPARAEAVSDEAIAAMDWPALQAAVASCTRCELCATRRSAVPGRSGAASIATAITGATWMALGTAPGRLDEKERRPVSGEAGQLLDNMFKAIAVAPERLYVSNLLKCRPAAADGSEQPATPGQLAACRPFLERELELAGTRLILTLGQSAAKGLLGAAARGRVLRHGALPVVATYHPDDLLRRPEDKAKAWADLCLARSAHDGNA